MRHAIRHGPLGTILLCLLPALGACSVTLRPPEVQPPRPSRVLPRDLQPLCAALAPALGRLGLEVSKSTPGRISCMFETKQHRLADRGEPINHLHEVAYVGAQKRFDHGRYLLTVTARPGEKGTTVRVVARIEGYDDGNRLLPSTGLIEKTFFAHLTEATGVDPIPR